MGANQQTSVPAFTAGQVLTAQQQTEINTGVPVFATTVERDAAFGGTGEKTLAEGQLCYLESTDVVQYYDGSSWATVGPSTVSGLTLISSTTIGTTVSSVAVTGAFSATYDNYRIIVEGGTASTATFWTFQLGATTSAYYAGYNGVDQGGAGSTAGNNNSAAWFFMQVTTTGFSAIADVTDPFNATRTGWHFSTANFATAATHWRGSGYQNSATSFTDFTIIANTGTITGGTIKVYGYKN